jgi:AmiR/NasT family two-component response regulator
MPHVIAVIEDLLFLSRVREAGRRAGIEVVQARDAAAIAAATPQARLVIVDADTDRIPWRAALLALRVDAALAKLPLVAFVSHVAADRAETARAAGIRRVLARGAFLKELPGLMATAAAGPAQEEKSP